MWLAYGKPENRQANYVKLAHLLMHHIKANFSDLTLALTAEGSEQFVCA